MLIYLSLEWLWYPHEGQQVFAWPKGWLTETPMLLSPCQRERSDGSYPIDRVFPCSERSREFFDWDRKMKWSSSQHLGNLFASQKKGRYNHDKNPNNHWDNVKWDDCKNLKDNKKGYVEDFWFNYFSSHDLSIGHLRRASIPKLPPLERQIVGMIPLITKIKGVSF